MDYNDYGKQHAGDNRNQNDKTGKGTAHNFKQNRSDKNQDNNLSKDEDDKDNDDENMGDKDDDRDDGDNGIQKNHISFKLIIIIFKNRKLEGIRNYLINLMSTIA